MKSVRLAFLSVAFLAGRLSAQPASITTIAQPAVFGPEVFDAAGNLYAFAGGPVTPGAAQTQSGGGTCEISNGFFDFPGTCSDAYVGKVDAAGKLVFGTYLGGPTADESTALVADAAGNVFVTGTTGGSFPTTPGAAIATSTTSKAFAAKISADGSRVLYSTYLPATAATPSSIAVDQQGNAYVAGHSSAGHAFVVKLSADGSAFLYNVALAGSMQDSAAEIVSDAGGYVIVAGQTASPDFPVTPGVFQSSLKGVKNLFVSRLDPGGHIIFSTLLGGSGTDVPNALQTDSTGSIYLAGQTSSLDFPTTAGSLSPTGLIPLWNNTSPAGFAAKLSGDGSGLVWSTYVMSMDHVQQNGVNGQGVVALAVGAAGDVYVTGLAGAGFPVTSSAPQICFTGPYADAFVAHLDSHGALADATYTGPVGSTVRGLGLAADGTVRLAWTNAASSVSSQIRFAGAGLLPAACLSPSVLNSASFYGNSVAEVVPGELITLTGFGIGPDTGVAYQPDAQGNIPRQLAGVQVLFDGQPAPVLYAQSRQINAVAPVELSGQTKTSISVIYNQNTIGSIPARVTSWGVPGIFRLQGGASTQAAAINQDGTLNGPANPAARGSVVSIWGTGFGLIEPSCSTGGLNPFAAVNLAASLSVGIVSPVQPVNTYWGPVQYAGGAPGLPCGIEQINMLVPADVGTGALLFYPDSLLALGDGSVSVQQSAIGFTVWIK